MSVLFLASSAGAASFSERCPDIAACAKAVGELTGQKYVFDPSVKGAVQTTPNLELTKENAELLFTNYLYLAGFARVPLGQPGTYQILHQRDARDAAIPLVRADLHTPPELPNTWDIFTVQYQASNPEVVEDMARTSRSFMPANSRIIPYEGAGTLLVTDSAPNLRKLYAIIIGLDRKPSAAFLKERARARAEAERERRKAKAAAGEPAS